MQCLKRQNVLYPDGWLKRSPLETELMAEPRIDDDCFTIPPLDSINPFQDCRAAPPPARRGASLRSPLRKPRIFPDAILTAIELLTIVAALAIASYVIGAASAIGGGQ